MVRVRFAPSPTGPLHIGGVRTTLFNYLFAKKHGGKLILRIEDTDAQRFVPGAEEYIIESFRWLGIPFDEGPHLDCSYGVNLKGFKDLKALNDNSPYGPYRQSERKEIYKKHINQLLEKGLAYIAFDTPEQLEAKRNETPNFQYDASNRMMMTNSLTLSKEETDRRIASGQQYVVRIKIEPDRPIVVNDLIRGEVTVNSSILDDKVLYKSSDQLPTYHLANIVDDHLMEITHVIRGEEWLPSAPLHVTLYHYFGWEDSMPRFAHLPLLLKPEGNGKLSKRDGDRLGFPVFPLQWQDPASGEISSGYREKGYLPEAVVNFLALLGWNPGDDREIISLEEMIDLFSLEKCSKSGAKFDYKKGIWFNHQYIQLKSDEEIAELFLPVLEEKLTVLHELHLPPAPSTRRGRRIENDSAAFLEVKEADRKSKEPVIQDFGKNRKPCASPSLWRGPGGGESIIKIVNLVKPRINFVHELWEQSAFFFIAPTAYDEKTVQKRWKEDSPAQLTELISVLESVEDFTSKSTEAVVIPWIESKGYPLGNVMNAFRLALVGESKGPHIFDITEILGKEEVIRRVKKAINELS